MAEQLPDHGQALAECQGAGGEGVPQVVDAHVVEPGARPDASPGVVLQVGERGARLSAGDDPELSGSRAADEW